MPRRLICTHDWKLSFGEYVSFLPHSRRMTHNMLCGDGAEHANCVHTMWKSITVGEDGNTKRNISSEARSFRLPHQEAALRRGTSGFKSEKEIHHSQNSCGIPAHGERWQTSSPGLHRKRTYDLASIERHQSIWNLSPMSSESVTSGGNIEHLEAFSRSFIHITTGYGGVRWNT